MLTANNWYGYFELECRDKEGNLLWTEEGPNALSNEGQQLVQQVFFQGAAGPAQFYIRLFNDTIVKTDKLTDLQGEPTTNGYVAILVERSAVGWPTHALDAGDYMISSKKVTFQASGGLIGPVTSAALCTSSDNTGKLVSFKALSQSRSLADSETLGVTFKEKFIPSA